MLLIAFNRPALVERVLAALAVARPPALYVAIDGPRARHPTDAGRCEAVRALVDGTLPWPCEVHRLVRTKNVGLQQAVITALDWFFTHEPMGVILEDDCVPAPDFLPFAGEVLTRWQHEPSVMHVSGVTMRPRTDATATTSSYHFARSGHVWGWATWRRAWQCFEPTLHEWPAVRATYRHTPDALHRALGHKFASAHAGRKWTWSRAWYWSMARQGGLSVIPAVNLIENVGDGPDATHQHGARHPLRRPHGAALSWPLEHPSRMHTDAAYDKLLARYHRGSFKRQLADRWWALRESLA